MVEARGGAKQREKFVYQNWLGPEGSKAFIMLSVDIFNTDHGMSSREMRKAPRIGI
jgi:hypothetical protein